MCGITGVIHRDGRVASADSIEKMTAIIEHRGPDARNTYCYQNLAFGHVRLSILDLSEMGAQPMHSKDGRYVLIYNGEVYNFKEIKAELETKGHNFRSTSDTEVILNAYIEWGDACVPKFNGMFAFLVLDKVKKTLFFARDRFGIKPLYYGEFNQSFIFGSEIKAIEQHPDYKFEINKAGLKEYFSFQNFLSEQTLNHGIKMFPAGHTATLNLEGGGELKLTEYWDYNFQEPSDAISHEECIEELDHLFQQAVQRQLVSDVELGSYLSGGMDSGSITAISSAHIQDMHTFTCGFDMASSSASEQGFDECDKAREFSAYFKTRHHEKIINHDDMQNSISKIAWHLEEPRVGQSYPNYYAAELARSNVKVVLSGAGGDELFAGYPWRYYRAVGSADKDAYIDNYYRYWQRLVAERDQQDFFAPIWNDIQDISTKQFFENIYTDSLNDATNPADFLNQSLYFEAKTFMHGLLVLEDKLSMAHSLESRVPILDNDLVEFAMKIPAQYKLASMDKVVQLSKQGKEKEIEKYFHRSKDGKLIFREAMAKHLPEETAKREKQGFSGPDASWFSNESADFIKDILYKPNANIYDLLDFKTVTDMLDRHFSNTINSRLLIWSLLNVEMWLEQHA